MADTLEAPDQPISLARAAALAGLSVNTLRHQAKKERLKVQRLGREQYTTRRWLHEYLVGRESAFGQDAPLPEGYRVPAGAAPGAARIVIRPREEEPGHVPADTSRPTDRYGPDGEAVSGRVGKKLGYPTASQLAPGRGRERLSRPDDGPDVADAGQGVPGAVPDPSPAQVPHTAQRTGGFQTRTRSSFPVRPYVPSGEEPAPRTVSIPITCAPAQEGKPDDPPAVEG